MNIYSFWLGNDAKKAEIISNYKGLKGAKLIIGPSDLDHKLLMAEYKFYRDAVKKGIYSFASDIWRAWAIKKYGSGLYIDTSVKIDINKLNRFIISIKKDNFKFIGFLENPTKIASCVFYSENNSKILDDYLYYYSTYKCFIKLFKIAPEIITKSIHINTAHVFSQNEINYKGGVKLMTLRQIISNDGITGIKKYGSGSWTKKPGNRSEYWIGKVEKFEKGYSEKQIKHFIKVDLKQGLWKLRGR